MSEAKVTALKEALAAQQKLLKQLYNDLDVEREASSTAASEALSMILRLQNEKALVKLEAEQYKRLAEEKMSYAEETMETFEDLVNQKEMEISALDLQVQAYRNKLLDIGFDDPGDSEMDFLENNLRRSEALMRATSTSSTSDRDFVSLVPSTRLPFVKTVYEVEGSKSPEDELISKGVGSVGKQLDQKTGLDKQNSVGAGNINSYWEQIRKLDDLVTEITGEPSTRLKSPSPHMQWSSNGSCGAISRTISEGYDQLKHPENKEKEVSEVHDVFEVPQPLDNFTADEGLAKKEGKVPLRDDEKPHFTLNKAFRQFVEGQDHDCLDKGLISQQRELNLSPPDGISVDCQLKIVQPTSACKYKIQQANNLSERSEVQSHMLRQECNNDGRVELQLLNEIQKQLTIIQSEIKSLKPKKSSSMENLRIQCLEQGFGHKYDPCRPCSPKFEVCPEES